MRPRQKATLIAACSLVAGLVLGSGAIFGWPWAGTTGAGQTLQPGHGPRTAHDLGSVRAYKGPLPAGALGGSVDSVTCPTPSHCVGIGDYYTAGSSRIPVLVVTGAGAVWKATAVQLPPGAQSVVGWEPFQLACPTISTCVGVGSFDGPLGSGIGGGLLVSGSGSSWKATRAPLPQNSSATPDAILSAVSCASAGVCIAIGTYTDTAGDGQGLLLARTVNSWSPLEVGATLNAVACAPHANCVIVGATYGRTAEDDNGAILTGTGASWKPTIAPLPANAAAPPGAGLNAVTCPSVRMCVAAGYYTDTSGKEDGLLLTGYGASWTAVETAHTGALLQVACSSSTACVAVGKSTLVLRTGAANSWTTIPIPLPLDAVKNSDTFSFNSTSCGPTPTCALAGFYETTAKDREGLIVAGSGRTWTAAKVPLAPNESTNSIGASMQSVACPLVMTCLTVGGYQEYTSGSRKATSDQPLIGVYNLP